MEPVNVPRRILFAECCPSPSVDPSDTVTAGHVYSEFLDGDDTTDQVVVVRQPSRTELASKLQHVSPDIVYLTGGTSSVHDLLSAHQLPLSFVEQTEEASLPTTDPRAIAQIFLGLKLDVLFIDSPLTSKQVEAITAIECCENLVYWPRDPQSCSVVASQFAHCFFAQLRNPSIVFGEAFTMAARSVHLLCENVVKERPQVPLLPNYNSKSEPDLPQCSSVPVDPIPNIEFLNGDIPHVEGWENVLLLAPKAEVRLLLCGGPSMIDPSRLSLLGEALRALLLSEMRSLCVSNITHCDYIPSNIAETSTAMRCEITCASGIEAVVVLGGPPSILSNNFASHPRHSLPRLHGVMSQLTSDCARNDVRRSSASVAGGTPVVDALVVTSVWALHILRGLCQSHSYRGLVSFGIAGVGGSALTRFKPGDTVRYNAIVTGMQSQPLIKNGTGVQEIFCENPRTLSSRPKTKSDHRSARLNGEMDVDLVDSLDNDSDYDMEMDPEYDVSSKESQEHTTIPSSHGRTMEYHSTRPLLSSCTETEFYDDLIAFLETRGKSLDRERFPEAVLNGGQLDLFNLYKEVVSRGGFRVGNGINWKGQVFPKMRNWTFNHRMTGVGNALKRHYQAFLCDYELAHPKDLTGDGCWLCGSNDESGTDWICCDHCERWIHFACDRRPSLRTFKEYATGDGGRTYHCPRCADALKHI